MARARPLIGRDRTLATVLVKVKIKKLHSTLYSKTTSSPTSSKIRATGKLPFPKDRAKDLFDLVESYGTQESERYLGHFFFPYYEKKKNEQQDKNSQLTQSVIMNLGILFFCGLWHVSGQVETDKWPLEELVRHCGRGPSDHGLRRGRVPAQIAQPSS